MAGYSCFARRLVTAQGYRLGVGGLCPAGRAADCAAALAPLAALELSGREDIYQVDYLLARAIQTHAPQELAVAGATLATGQRLPQGARTGGVVGSPREEIASAGEALEQLPQGFCQCAIPGGPGLVAQAAPEAVAQALEELRRLKPPSRREVLAILARAAIPTALVVYDGTGSGAHGFLLALAAGRAESVELEAPPAGADAP